jgi:acyl-CoA synthetase (AMP-forming)/AMP-acid ligase II
MAPSAAVLNHPAMDVLSRNDKIKLQTRSADVKAPRTIDELIRQRGEELPNEAILSYPSSGIDYADYSFQDLNEFASRVAERYKALIPCRSSSLGAETVVGLLGPSGFEYFITALALTKLGHTVLFLSTRISIPAYVSLLQATGAQHIVVGGSFRETIGLVKRSLSELNVHDIAGKCVWESPSPSANSDLHFSPQLDLNLESSKVAWIIHSSGSTGLPKPIYQTHSAALQNYSSNLNLRGFITLPLYHAHGLSSVFRAIHSRKQIYLYNADLPLTQRHLLDIMQRYDFQIFYGVPYALKLLGESVEGIAALAKLDVVMFGGSACPDSLGNRLVDNGVNLISHYGT